MKTAIASLILVLGCLSGPVHAQTKLYGDLTDAGRQRVEFATVALKNSLDSVIADLALSDSLGGYAFPAVPAGTYFLEISHVGYAAMSTPPFTVSGSGQMRLETQVLQSASTTLSTVTVVSRRPLVERKIDRTVVNVEAAFIASGGNALDVLEISPGVTVGPNGSISLAGKAGVVVFIDGKPSYLSSDDLAAFLANLRSDQLDQIEIMTNPPAKYDAAGNAGIINIRTKKVKMRGFNGSYSAAYTQGRYGGLNSTLNLNYRSRAFNLFGTLGYGDQQSFDDYSILRNLRDLETDALRTVYNQETGFVNRQQSYNAKLGMDYFLSERTTLGFVVGGFSNPREESIRNTTLLQDPAGNLLTTLIAPATSTGDWQNLNTNLNLQHRFDSAGHELSLSLDYVFYDVTNRQLFNNTYYAGGVAEGESPVLTEELQNVFPQRIDIFSGQADYTRPLGRNTRLDMGLKASSVRTDSDAQFFSRQAGDWLLNDSLSNRFAYEENITAAYLNINRRLQKWEFQLGLRLEHTNAEGRQLTTNQNFTRNFAQLFPTFYLQYQLDADQLIALSYGRRIDRPDYADLNPFRYYLDQFTYEEGNPDLLPQFSHNLELTHSMMEGALTTTLYVNRTSDVIQEIILQNIDRSETFIRPENLSSSRLAGIRVNIEAPLADGLVTTLYLNYYNEKNEGLINDRPFTIQANTFSGALFTQYRFAKRWSAIMAAAYSGRSISGTFIQRPYGRLGLALEKKILGNNGSVRLSANDIFRWVDFRAASRFQNVDILVDNVWQTQNVRLSFNYRFQSGLSAKPRELDSSVEGETDRVKSRARKE